MHTLRYMRPGTTLIFKRNNDDGGFGIFAIEDRVILVVYVLQSLKLKVKNVILYQYFVKNMPKNNPCLVLYMPIEKLL